MPSLKHLFVTAYLAVALACVGIIAAPPVRAAFPVYTVGQGGTGAATFTQNGVLIGSGANPITAVTPGASGYILKSNGSGSAPSWIPNVGYPFPNANNGTSTTVTFSNGLAASGSSTIVSTTFLSNGNVGVGTSTPGSLFSIGGVENVTAATTTRYATGGLNLTGGGCYAVNGICIGVTGGGTVTSVGLSVPSFLSVSGSPITTNGSLTVSLSGTALPVANGGTGSTTPVGVQWGDGAGLLKTLSIGSGLSLVGGTLSATGGSGNTTTLYFSQESGATTRDAIISIPVVAGDVILATGYGLQTGNCQSAQTAAFNYKQSTYSATTSIVNLGAWTGGNSPCTASWAFKFTATTTETVNFESSGVGNGDKFNTVAVSAIKTH